MSYQNFSCDFHLHGLYSGGVSKKMKIPIIAREAKKKGLDLVVTSDALHPKWLEHLKNNLREEGNGIYSYEDMNFLVGTEVRDKNRVDHVILLPNLQAAIELRSKLKNHTKDIDKDGRPFVYLNGEELTEKIIEVGGLIGCAHAFTPFYGLYAHFDSYKECYGNQWKNVHFLELGLSADSYFADFIEELHDITFLSNSDAHSPWPFRLGREFNKLRMKELGFEEIEKALKRESGRKPVLNLGLNCKAGKYHKTACTNCKKKYEMKYAQSVNWECPSCGRNIKKGVKDRILELGNKEENSPKHRPPYKRLVPLSEIIAKSLGISSLYSKKVRNTWKNFYENFGSEIEILLETPYEDLKKLNKKVGEAVEIFREEKYIINPGGGGKYGEIILPKSEKERKKIQHQIEAKMKEASSQTSLADF